MAWLGKSEAELKVWEQELDAREKSLNENQAQIERKKNDLCEQEMEVELNTKNGFAEKNLLALREIEKRESLCKEFEKTLKARENEIFQRTQNLEKKAEELRKRETSVMESEIKRDEGFVEKRKMLDEELAARRSEFFEELSNRRKQEMGKLEKILTQEELTRIALLDEELKKLRLHHQANIQREQDELDKSKESLATEKAKIEELKDEMRYQEMRIQSCKNALDERVATLNVEVEDKINERKQSLENEKSFLSDENSRLRESIRTSSALISNFEELKRKLGGEDPAAILLKLKTYEEDIKILRDDLATRPTQEMQEAFDRIKTEKENIEREKDRYKEKNKKLVSTQKSLNALEAEIDSLKILNKTLSDQRDNIEAHNNQLQADLKRLRASYEHEQDRAERIQYIETPYVEKEVLRASSDEDELQWLEKIRQSCCDYGLKFPRRILYAFHTALKTSEWSPITVLAGVSGTGKSELPRLYSHFGGINFMSLSVQPNWDSQESMFGFFNSIDNKFDAQPVLRLLAQTQNLPTYLRERLVQGNLSDSELKQVKSVLGELEPDLEVEKYKLEKKYPGLGDVMNLILMDEMNLAHVELYFAEFLSKLELRRGLKGNKVPNLEVKLGAGIQPYNLPLGRNVLWVGTMNQDETTKSLSDKVLDRGIVINFPRPTTLERRLKLTTLSKQTHLLPRSLWESWWCKESKFNNDHEDRILLFKKFIEEINTSLSKVGRAIGHRAWQSIEYYISNYPDVLEALRKKDDANLVKSMKVAFEDQLVQKVMPKLRGIETRGKSKTECLDKIRTQLKDGNYAIVDDFDLACEFGHGQFIWNSANYLKDDDPASSLEKAEN
ncbi:MAG: chromosome partitioning protein ParA [Oligoflexia bacterium]|nr:chromosome partitioning protein ParA [Oligoflexia bacterium]